MGKDGWVRDRLIHGYFDINLASDEAKYITGTQLIIDERISRKVG